jgi:ABC-type branched-subunit amino acid transport system substrate-binding protein
MRRRNALTREETDEQRYTEEVMQIRSLNRRSAVIAASAVVLAAICSTPVAVQAQQKNVKIAVIVPLSGPWARQGTLVKYGAETAVNEINAAGGIKALGGAKLELVAIDAGVRPRRRRTPRSVLSRRNPTWSAAWARGSPRSRSR